MTQKQTLLRERRRGATGSKSEPVTASRVLNRLPRVGWARLPAGPRYLAYETHASGVFHCPVYGPQLVTAEQLQSWAEQVGAEIAVVTAAEYAGFGRGPA